MNVDNFGRREFVPLPAGSNQEIQRIVVLQEALDAAADRFDDANLPSAVAYHVKAKMVDDVQDGWELDPDRPITLFNRGQNVAYAADTLGTYKSFLGKLQFLPLDCPPTDSSSFVWNESSGRV